ncbi:MAG TPA: DNA gyrase subunit A, partial [Anaerolineae bacterium]|nr:DNA gyrase subunit A [Anaerolineae bacterium]
MEIGNLKSTDIRDEMQTAYLDYAMSVITARALPDVRDGLKPVQRRILYQMSEMGLRHNVAHRKCARIVGDVLGRFHPHGDQSVYDALVRLAQDFTMRYPLVDGQGNFGSIDGDPPAAMRYTEARLTELAEELLADIDMDTVDFVPNFDDTLKQPTVLPGKVPNLLINGGNGIAVGMATLIPPHNLGEICDAINYLIENWNKVDDIEPDDLMEFVKGPDFPTGGIILGTDGIKEAYATGKGRIIVRGKIHSEPMSGGRNRIIISEIPYQVNKSSLIERIAELVRDRRIEEIGDLRDESDRQGMSIVIELKRSVEATPVINSLLKHTALQSTFSVNMLALVDGEPRVLSLKRSLQLFVQHRQIVITRRTQFELERAKLRAHILEGLKIALDYLDEVIRIIRQSQDADQARERLMKRFKLSEIQATAILDMQLRRLAALERKKIEDELAEVKKRIKYLEDLLKSPKRILGVIQEECSDLKERFGDARRTFIAQTAETEFKEESHTEEGVALVTLSRDGVVRKAPTAQYRRTRSDAVNGVQERSDDPTIAMLIASTTDTLALFTNRGRALALRMSQVPDVARNPGGISLANQLEQGEKFVSVIAFNGESANTFVTLATTLGKIKRTALEEFASIPAGGTRAANLAEGDEVGWAYLTHGGGEFLITTAKGQALRFAEDDVPVQGRAAAGVWAIKLAEGDRVASLEVVQPDAWLVVASARGFAKRVPLKEFPTKGRYTGGVTVFAPDNKTGDLTSARIASLDEDVSFVAASGLNVRVRVENITKGNRGAKGKLFVNLKENDSLTRLTSLGGQPESASEESAPKAAAPKQVEKDQAAPALLPKAVSTNGNEKANGHKSKSEAPAAKSKPKKEKQRAREKSKPARPARVAE